MVNEQNGADCLQPVVSFVKMAVCSQHTADFNTLFISLLFQ